MKMICAARTEKLSPRRNPENWQTRKILFHSNLPFKITRDYLRNITLLMDRLRLLEFLLLLLLFSEFDVEAQSYGRQEDQTPVSTVKPTVNVVIALLCIMCSFTFILIIYAKFCHRPPSVDTNPPNNPTLITSTSRFSGIDKKVIESLPFFKFSSLKGLKQGLECSVCLAKFEDIEILRLLPKCKHAFHINCIDQWLEKHSSCPLCRHKVNAEDPSIFAYSNSMRFLLNPSVVTEDSNIELYVQREEDHQGSSRFSVGSSFREIKDKETNKEEQVLIGEEDGNESENDRKVLHKFNHKIIISDVILKNRWSCASSSDLLLLNSEMLNVMSSQIFSNLEGNNGGQFQTSRVIENEQMKDIKEEMEMKRLIEIKTNSINKTTSGLGDASGSDSVVISRSFDPARRSVSEITAFSRFQELDMKNRIRETCFDGDERRRRVWLPIAKRTVQWFAEREKRSQQSPQKILDV
ncbi:E3 ubiquitin-protein ligase ATL42-like [Mangifera indica]|uniref:E3 ubiquitin-protein ligase ATL42-like n=1 Tax=Mangifera indica TaxID=29780 RepID=UPI001CFB1385|nr:E3 ubiquitin-protein ligase ATL42-like [Mangifera indica]